LPIYNIEIVESEPQEVDVAEHYWIKNPDAGEPKQMKKSNSIIFKDKIVKRTSTIDKVITEKMANNEDFEKMLNDPLFNQIIVE
jgi:hypothetical protein